MFLETEGYEVTVAHNGVVALRTFQAEHPAAVFVDVNMPEMDGFAFVRALREQPGGDAATVVMMTGRPDLVKKQAGLDIQHVLPKPFLLDDVLALVSSMKATGLHGSAA